MVGEAGKVAGSVIEPLRWTPLLLALVIFDVLYLILRVYGQINERERCRAFASP
jgi:hypothetical protein